ncbi:MAG: Rieske (2Fe-2S) protein [Armatimonadetes bacterium]|nr:Rieske (2Fe-2S) protein [Armatimonadota bacterium]MDE2205776.1 Rieske (2Fe-2S) protein [Armatimonadota bacterium]
MSGRAEEKWRRDFPIAWSNDNYIARREFTKFLVLISGAAFAGSGYFVLLRARRRRETHARPVFIATQAELAPGTVKLFRFPTADSPAMLIRLSNGDYAAYQQRCTHLSCPVYFVAATGHLQCPCHNGAFDAASGRVLYGPPPRPLPKITLQLRAGRIYATGVEAT